MARGKFWLSGIALLAVVMVVSCTEEKIINNYHTGTQAEVTGSVELWRCGVGDPLNNNMFESHLFDYQTSGDSCLITFTRLNGLQYSFYTGDSASIEVVLDRGPYMITLESRWTLPHTYSNVYVDNDTTIELDLVNAVLDPDTLMVSFRYEPGDSMGAAWEWKKIRRLNGFLGNKLWISGINVPDSMVMRREVYELSSRIYTLWPIVVRTPEYHVWDVGLESQEFAQHYSSDTASLSVHPRGLYICLF